MEEQGQRFSTLEHFEVNDASSADRLGTRTFAFYVFEVLLPELRDARVVVVVLRRPRFRRGF
jgi:hypothetical protein